ncbi:MAG: bactofilin family protein [Bacteroidia bacterium]
MLSKKEKTVQNTSGVLNVLGEGTVIEGNLSSSGDLRIDGEIQGDLSTNGKCVLGPTGKIVGNIQAKSCDVSGRVDGNVRVTDLLLIKSNGKINGDINTSKIVVENGGEFNGSCVMGSSVSISKDRESNNAKSARA